MDYTDDSEPEPWIGSTSGPDESLNLTILANTNNEQIWQNGTARLVQSPTLRSQLDGSSFSGTSAPSQVPPYCAPNYPVQEDIVEIIDRDQEENVTVIPKFLDTENTAFKSLLSFLTADLQIKYVPAKEGTRKRENLEGRAFSESNLYGKMPKKSPMKPEEQPDVEIERTSTPNVKNATPGIHCSPNGERKASTSRTQSAAQRTTFGNVTYGGNTPSTSLYYPAT